MQLTQVLAGTALALIALSLAPLPTESRSILPIIPLTNHIVLNNGLVQAAIGIGVQIGSAIATLGAAALAAHKWKIENTQQVIYKQPVITKQVPVVLRPVVAVKDSELTKSASESSGGDLTSLTGSLGASLAAVSGEGKNDGDNTHGTLQKTLNAQLTAQLNKKGNELVTDRRSAPAQEVVYIYQ